MKTREMASEFVKRYWLLFTEDKDYWIEKIEELLIKNAEDTRKEIVEKVQIPKEAVEAYRRGFADGQAKILEAINKNNDNAGSKV